ncbi:MAG: hypothetical protein Q9227_007677 [Pyrenula ochraceoflavens]
MALSTRLPTIAERNIVAMLLDSEKRERNTPQHDLRQLPQVHCVIEPVFQAQLQNLDRHGPDSSVSNWSTDWQVLTSMKELLLDHIEKARRDMRQLKPTVEAMLTDSSLLQGSFERSYVSFGKYLTGLRKCYLYYGAYMYHADLRKKQHPEATAKNHVRKMIHNFQLIEQAVMEFRWHMVRLTPSQNLLQELLTAPLATGTTPKAVQFVVEDIADVAQQYAEWMKTAGKKGSITLGFLCDEGGASLLQNTGDDDCRSQRSVASSSSSSSSSGNLTDYPDKDTIRVGKPSSKS